jgi:hypothetical protein
MTLEDVRTALRRDVIVAEHLSDVISSLRERHSAVA